MYHILFRLAVLKMRTKNILLELCEVVQDCDFSTEGGLRPEGQEFKAIHIFSYIMGLRSAWDI